MGFLCSVYTNKGKVKKVNQDSVLVMEAETKKGNVLLAAVSDGMGGLAHGEEASFRMVNALKFWFTDTLPLLIDDFSESVFKESMQMLIFDVCANIESYADACDEDCGTTLAALLLVGRDWYVVNVGDSRVYLYDKKLKQITKDQTYVQREMDAGRMTEKEAETHRMRSLLLQCIGASDVVVPDWYSGTDCVFFMLCSDGFRHVVKLPELSRRISPRLDSEAAMSEALETIANKSMDAGERDNISAVIVKVV